MIISTVEKLREYMQDVDPKHEFVTADRLIWFVCIQEARILSDATTKDIAGMFRDGIEPINSLAQVQGYLDMIFDDCDLDNITEDDEEYVNDQNGDIIRAVYDFYGVDARSVICDVPEELDSDNFVRCDGDH